MSYPAKLIAEWFITRASNTGKELTQIKIQKLVYIAHGWHLALTGEPLINEEIQAWQWGPVIPSLYKEYVKYGSSPINTIIRTDEFSSINKQTLLILNRVWDVYAKYSPAELTAITHRPGTPWTTSYQPGIRNTVIDNEVVKKHYLQLSDR